MHRSLRVTTLGEFALAGPDGPIDAPLPGVVRSLLVRLARARRPLTRDELAAIWWPDADPQRARASLSTALWTLRTALKGALAGDPLETNRDTVALRDGIAIDVDVDRFEAAIASGDDPGAEAWYGGEYLRGVSDDAVLAERERLAARYEAVLARLLTSDPDADRARRLVAADPYSDIGYRVLVDAALAEGASTAARAWLRRARAAFAEIGATPGFFAERPYRTLLELDAEREKRTNLPSDTTAFVGRAAEIEAVEAALREAAVVTILGAGGSGKTRLAREVAGRDFGVRYPCVWFVDLTAAEGEGAVESAIAATLGVREDAGPTIEVLIESLRDSDVLLVVDNCEHVVEHAANAIARIVREAPLVRVLATSREALRIEAESVVPLEGLATVDATALFLARARAADRRLTIDDEIVTYAARIVEALDGLPLAIELVAGRVRVDGVRAIAADALGVAGAALGPRDRTQRHQTIGASIAWSVERLDAPAQTLFGRLGAFAGPFEPEDAFAVDLDRSEALERLIDRSLVVRSDPFGVTLRMLAPVREDARARLAAEPRFEDVRDAHAERIRTLAIGLLAARGGDDGSAAEARLDERSGDIDVALERLYAGERIDDAIDLTTALTSHWATRGARSHAERWLARGDALVCDDRRRGDLAYARSRFAHDASDVAEMLRFGELARDAYARAGNASGEAKAWNVIGSALIGPQESSAARAALEASLRLQRDVGDEYGIAIALINLSVLDVEAKRLDEALAALVECEPIIERVATVQPRIKVQNNIAYVRLAVGDRAGSRLATDRAMALAESSRNDAMIAFAAANAAIRFAGEDDVDAATAFAVRVGELAEPPARYVAYALIARAVAETKRRNTARAIRFAAAARALEPECGGFEVDEATLLEPLPGDGSEAIDRGLPSARALLAGP